MIGSTSDRQDEVRLFHTDNCNWKSGSPDFTHNSPVIAAFGLGFCWYISSVIFFFLLMVYEKEWCGVNDITRSEMMTTCSDERIEQLRFNMDNGLGLHGRSHRKKALSRHRADDSDGDIGLYSHLQFRSWEQERWHDALDFRCHMVSNDINLWNFWSCLSNESRNLTTKKTGPTVNIIIHYILWLQQNAWNHYVCPRYARCIVTVYVVLVKLVTVGRNLQYLRNVCIHILCLRWVVANTPGSQASQECRYTTYC